MEINGQILATFILYFIFMFGIGLYFYRRSKNLSDYILGGRSLNGWVTALSAQASDMSGWLLLGLPGAIYLSGINGSWIAIGLLVGTYLNWRFVAKRLRIYTEKTNNAITIPDYLENRFEDKTRILRIFSATFILLFFLIYTASGFVAGATLFNAVFGVNYQVALAIGAIIVISYTFLGGYLAVCWTDFFQGSLMFFAIIIVPIAAIIYLGGFTSAVSHLDTGYLNWFKDMNGSSIGAISVISSLAWGLGYFGQPHILTRFMGIRDAKEISKARHIAMVWVTFSLIGAVLVGLFGQALIPNVDNSEQIFMAMIQMMFHPLVAGILLAAILAAVMSTADSQLLVTASAITEDFYKVLIRKKASQKELLWVSRITVMFVAIIAYLIATNPNNSVMDLVSNAWAGFGATFGPVILLSLYWKKMNWQGAMASMLGGGVTVILAMVLHSPIYEIVPGFLVGILLGLIVTILTKGASISIQKGFEEVRQER